jgi:predicted AlkP superfamily phosphohydrolase/phosphomutase/tetratricopeptide (TPR) repeat protein
MPHRRVLLIGWDAADWKVIHPLVDAGHMPHLARLMEQGVMGNIATLQPVLSPMLWTSIATGKRPYKHGVHGFTEVSPETGEVRPISARSRVTKAIWNILHQEGKTCHVIGWWPSHPVEPLRGVMVSNHFQQAVGPLDKPWPLPAGMVHPPELAETLAGLRVHPHELVGDMLRAFVPRAAEIDQKKDQRLGVLAKMVAEMAGVQAAATHALHARPDWDFCAVYQDAIDHFSHAFMRYHPPRLPWVSEEDFAFYSQVLGGAYVFHDTMLGALLALAGDDVTVILVSDHGFHPDHMRVRSLPNEPAGPAAEHRPLGIFVAAGPGIRRDGLISGATLLDICPTILSLYGLPVGRDMDGRPLLDIYEAPPTVTQIDSWDDVPGDAAVLEGVDEGGSEAAAAAIQQLADLGYIDAVPEDRQEAVDQTLREQRWNLARSLADGGRLHEAAEMLTDLWNRWPNESRFGVAIFEWLLELGQFEAARETLKLLASRKQAAMEEAAVDLRAFVKEIRREQGLPETDAEDLWADVDREALSEQHHRRLRHLRGRVTADPRTFTFLEAKLFAAERQWAEALARLESIEGVEPSRQPALHLERGNALLALRRPAEAAAAFRAVVEIDPLHAMAHFGLARAAFNRGDEATAVSEARAATGCRPHFPAAHLLAGLALWRSGDISEAEQHLRGAVAQAPGYAAAHRLLATFLGRERHDYAAAADHQRLAREARRRRHQRRESTEPRRRSGTAAAEGGGQPDRGRPPAAWTASLRECLIVVTGLPRSGTSMAMQMLAAGGVPVLADDQRLADESNPKGYVEFEPVKRIMKDAPWLEEAVGKAVKIVTPLVQHLPHGETAPPMLVIVMRRPIADVIASQRAMLARSGKDRNDIGDEALATIYERQATVTRTFLQRLESRGRARVLDMAYAEAVADPEAMAARLAAFLGEGEGFSFNAAAAAAVVEPALHRHKAGGPNRS